MKHLFSKLLCIAAFASASTWAADTTNCCCTVAPYLSLRSQSEDAARELVGWTEHVNLASRDVFYSSASLTPQYNRSFRPTDIASLLFGCDLQGCDCRSIYIRGMQVADRNSTQDWASAYFYLPNDFKSNICFNPLVQNFLVDFNLYLGLDEWVRNLYFRIHAPITHTKWALQPFEDSVVTNTSTISQFGSARLATDLDSFYNYSCAGMTPANQTVTIANVGTRDITFQGLHYAKICPCVQKRTGLSDIQADLGWNWVRDRYHIGIFARTAMPTGNRPNGEYLFEPIVGNGKQWEFGGGITSHVVLYDWKNQNRTVSFFCDANLTHMFSARQRRVFDLCANGPLSRYMLAARTLTSSPNQTVQIAPVANLTRCTVNVSSAIQVDIVALLNYFHNNFTLDMGYNFWARSCEKIKCADCDCCNSSCQELDGKTWRTLGAGNTIHTIQSVSDLISAQNVYALNKESLNTNGARTRGISNKVFTHFSYNWFDSFDRTVPYLGFGMEVEFGVHHATGQSSCCANTGATSTNAPRCCCVSSTSLCCRNCAISQWGFWAKGGLSF